MHTLQRNGKGYDQKLWVFRYLPDTHLLLAFDDYQKRRSAKHVCRKLNIWEESWIFQSLCQKSIDAVRLVFNVDKVYRKRNNLVVLALIYWCIWIKDCLGSANRQENLDVIVMIFLRIIIILDGIFLFWFSCCKFYASNLFRLVCIIKRTICPWKLDIYLTRSLFKRYIFLASTLFFFSLLSCALLLDHIPESYFTL